jgi:hypothetical protein
MKVGGGFGHVVDMRMMLGQTSEGLADHAATAPMRGRPVPYGLEGV